MTEINAEEKRILENFFMSSGYVLDFSNRTFYEFFRSNFNIDIYDEEYNYISGSKANRLRAFWDKQTDALVSDSILKLIKHWEVTNLLNGRNVSETEKEIANHCKQIAVEIGSRQNSNTAGMSQLDEIKFLGKTYSVDIQNLEVSDDMKVVMQQRFDEIKICLANKVYLGAIFLIGSVLEGLLSNLAKKHPEEFNKVDSAPKDSGGKTRKFKDWSLSNLIDAACEAKYIGLDVKKFAHGLRDFRNYIHPEEQVKQKFNPNEHTANIAFGVLLAVIDDISHDENVLIQK